MAGQQWSFILGDTEFSARVSRIHLENEAWIRVQIISGQFNELDPCLSNFHFVTLSKKKKRNQYLIFNHRYIDFNYLYMATNFDKISC